MLHTLEHHLLTDGHLNGELLNDDEAQIQYGIHLYDHEIGQTRQKVLKENLKLEKCSGYL
jgi:hypothetical protein